MRRFCIPALFVWSLAGCASASDHVWVNSLYGDDELESAWIVDSKSCEADAFNNIPFEAPQTRSYSVDGVAVDQYGNTTVVAGSVTPEPQGFGDAFNQGYQNARAPVSRKRYAEACMVRLGWRQVAVNE